MGRAQLRLPRWTIKPQETGRRGLLDDLRCFFRTAGDVEAAGGLLLPVAWGFATAQGPTDGSVRVLEARRQTAAEVTRLGRPLAKPLLPPLSVRSVPQAGQGH